MESNDEILLRNLGFDTHFFQKIEMESTYIIRREKIRKVGSENAVVKLENRQEIIRSKDDDDICMQVYNEIEQNELLEADDKNFTTYIYDSKEINRETNNPVHANEENSAGIENENQPSCLKIEKNLEIFQNCSHSQLNQLNQMFKNINSSQNEKVMVKAYKSKLKTKFYQIYEENSQQFKENIKYKIFHKCNFPTCGRTFASAGWLKNHFSEHMKELKKNKFNIMFENLIENVRMGIFQMVNS